MKKKERKRWEISVKGVVQGIGFRPFVYRTAVGLSLDGWVRNEDGAVTIAVEGEEEKLIKFRDMLLYQHPPLARIDNIKCREIALNNGENPGHKKGFNILSSQAAQNGHHYERYHFGASEVRMETTPSNSKPNNGYESIPPDCATCFECEKELFDPNDRRYLYPFINCTNCGPRFTIANGVPYDRDNTTMRDFMMCEKCQEEYDNPMDRRFHAQPNACPRCGPQIFLADAGGHSLLPKAGNLSGPTGVQKDRAIWKLVRQYLKAGKIVALKSLGGFHLACDPFSRESVNLLRARKKRPDKPFALMFKNLDAAQAYCHLSSEEAKLLASYHAPILVLRGKGRLPREVGPGVTTVGAMLPYTPLHQVLFWFLNWPALIMTSGNQGGKPLCKTNAEALAELSSIADLFLLHDRPIENRIDDSVEALEKHHHQRILFRRARGCVPRAITVPLPGREANDPEGGQTQGKRECMVGDIIGVGGDIKNTFCLIQSQDENISEQPLTPQGNAFVSQYLGDMAYLENQQHWWEMYRKISGELYMQPVAAAADSHPGYYTRGFIGKFVEMNKTQHIQSFEIQHHWAHMAACMAEHNYRGKAWGIICDGSGMGEDGNIWGSEILFGDYLHYERKGHFCYLPLPGGEAAIKQPALLTGAAAVHLLGKDAFQRLLSLYPEQEKQLKTGKEMYDQNFRLSWSSGLGRLFDIVAFITGVCSRNTYEGEAAILLENLLYGGDKKERANTQTPKGQYRSSNGNDSIPYPINSYPMNYYPVNNIQDPDRGENRISQYKLDPSPLLEGVIEDLENGVTHSQIAYKFHRSLAEGLAAMLHCCSSESKTQHATVCLSGGVFQNQHLTSFTTEILGENGWHVLNHKQLSPNDENLSLGQAVIAAWRCDA